MRPRHLAVGATAVFVVSSVFIFGGPSGKPTLVAEPLLVTEAYRIERDNLRRDETLSHMFARHGLGAVEVENLVAAARVEGMNPRRIRPETTFGLRIPTGSVTPDRVELRLDDDVFLRMSREAEGDWTAERITVGWSTSVHLATGTFSDSANSLDAIIRQRVPTAELSAGERSRLVWATAEAVFGWVIDFTRDPRPGDTFAILYERYTSEREDVRFGRVLAAVVEVDGEAMAAYVLPDDRGENTYYDEQGRSMHRAFLKYPVTFRRISSGFSRRRFHPVLRRYRAHLGTDYAAVMGTPIRATGDGVIDHAGRNGSFGLMVSIKHPKGIETRYAHMSALRNGLRPGARVKQGDIIGRVGMSGLATGPHVHYEFLKNGRQVNHRNIDLGDGEPLPQQRLGEFAAVRAEFDRMLQASEFFNH